MKYLLSVLLLVITGALIAQVPQNSCNPNKKLSFGFGFGPNYSLLKADSLPDNFDLKNGVGFRVGGFMKYALRPNFIIAPKAELSFNKGSLVQLAADNSELTNKVLPTTFDFMLHFHYKIGRNYNKPYLLVGAGYKLPVINTFGLGNDISIDLGLGFEKIVHYIVFSPELRYSYGLKAHAPIPTANNIKYHNLSLVLNFN